MTLRILLFFLLPLLGMAQTNSKVEMPMVGNTTSEKQALEIKRNVQYNLEEIKVRWKKAALENCTGVPCIIIPPPPSFTCGTSTISDIDNNSYNTVLIGSQCWTTTNLKVTKYDEGSLIPDLTASTSSPWATSGARTDYTGATGLPTGQTYVSTYGYLYNWYAVNDTRRLCPSGWHVPTDAEWTILTDYLGGLSVAGGKLKSTGDNTAGTGLWNFPNTGANNTSGFSTLPGGYRNRAVSFLSIRVNAFFWSASDNAGFPWYRELSNNNSNVNRSTTFKEYGASVRCLRD